MRSLRLIGAGVLLLAAVFVLTSLLGAGSGVAAVVIWVLWFVVAGANGWLGVRKGGYGIAEEAPVFLLVFGVPAAVACVLWWAGVPTIHTGRTWWVLLGGVLLWGGITLLATLQLVTRRTALITFIVVWIAWCAVNAVRGVVSAGYSVGEEAGVFVLNAAVPIAVALIVAKVSARWS